MGRRNIYITESQLNAIRESAGDLEYHFTTLRGLCGMMETDTFDLGENNENNRFGISYMSLSRLRTSAAGYGHGVVRLEDGPAVRIELDGRRLNNVRHINVRPYNYFYNEVLPNMRDEDFDEIPDSRMKASSNGYSEFEDSVTLKNGEDQIRDAIDYVTRIDIFLRKRIGSHMGEWNDFLKDIRLYPDWAEKMHFFTNINDFDYQRNEIPSKDIYGLYAGEYKQALEENKKMGKRIYITESQLSAILESTGVIDEGIAIIDNTKDVENLIKMDWASPDDFWFIQVTQRKKDFRNYNKKHGGNSKWWTRVQGVDGTSRENFAGYGVVKGNTMQDAINCLHNIKIKLNPWAAHIIGQTEVRSNGNMEAIRDVCDKLWARAYITINKRSMARTQRIAQKGGLRAFEKESSKSHRDATYYPNTMLDMDINNDNAAAETLAVLKKLNILPFSTQGSHQGTHYFFKNRDIMNYSENSPEFSPIAKKYASDKQPGEAFTMKEDAKMIIYSPCGQ